MTHQPPQKGYALLFAVLISSLLLAIGLSILAISKKELLLSAAGRESQFAFYAADTGLECALHSDFGGAFDQQDDTVAPPAISCVDVNVASISSVRSVTPPVGQTPTMATDFQFIVTLTPPSGKTFPCATVTVDKRYDSTGTLLQTLVRSRGYDTCDTSDPRRTERGIRALY